MNTKKEKLIFVIHKHHASHLHYDLRLEKNGVLKSWAVPKKPPKETGIKRLAIQVKDHPLDYANFQGEIAEGSYGAGLVEIWDKGYYIPLKFKTSEIIFELKGKKLKGIYCLIRLKKPGKNWLFFKRKAQKK